MESIGGYRIIRRLASGARADVFLGHAGHGAEGDPQLAAIKVFHPGVPEGSVDAEIGALSRMEHPHIVQLLDLASGPRNDAVLILQRLEPGGLARLLADRGTLEAGETVTILAPLVAAVGAMHRAGVTHGRLGASVVLFDGSGAPVLCGFGSAHSIGDGNDPLPPARLDQDARVLADIDGMVALTAAMLARVDGSTAPALMQWLAEQRRNTQLLDTLEARLFELAEPTAVVFNPEPFGLSIPSRFDAGLAIIPAHEATVPAPGEIRPRLSRSGWIRLPSLAAEWMENQRGKEPSGLVLRLDGVMTALRLVRRRVWAVAGIGLAAMVAAFAIIQVPVSTPRDDTRPASAAVAEAHPLESNAVAGDDPVVAAQALLEVRARCLLERSILCLDAVHQADSAAWQADAASIQEIQAGAELPADSFSPDRDVTLLDRMGDTALVGIASPESAQVNATASVLMIRTEAGWRFRGLLEGSPPLGG